MSTGSHTTIRPFTPSDADQVATLLTARADSPNRVTGGITAEDVLRELQLRRTVAFFVAEDTSGEVPELYGTLGLFRTSGRRTTAPREVIADMFYLAPGRRGGTATGRLFAASLEAVFDAGYDVLRLTVNPANTTAFSLYRRVGSVCLRHTTAGADGNVELVNHVPLVLRAVAPHLDDTARAALRAITSFGSVTAPRGADLSEDLEIEDGKPVVRYRLRFGGYSVEAVVDPLHNVVDRAVLTDPNGIDHALALPIRGHQQPVGPQFVELAVGSIRATVDTRDGLLRVFDDRADVVGPLLTATLPNLHEDRLSGWRDSQPRVLDVHTVGDAIVVIEHSEDVSLRAEFEIGLGGVRRTYSLDVAGDRPPQWTGELYDTVGLRHGTVDIGDGPVSTASGVDLRDCSEMPSAAVPIDSTTGLIWEDASRGVRLGCSGMQAGGLVTGTLLAHRVGPGTQTVDVTVDLTPHHTVRQPISEHIESAKPVETVPNSALALDVDRGVLARWRRDGHRVLSTPWPRTSAIGPNPARSGGLWVTPEPGRADRDHGIGWGAAQSTSWTRNSEWLEGHGGLVRWSARHHTDSVHEILAVEVEGGGHGDVVVWSTPTLARGARIGVRDGAGPETMLDVDRRFEVWTDELSVPTAAGVTLRISNITGHHPEILVRATSSGLLVGCVTAAADLPALWEFDCTDTVSTLSLAG
ncbi:GNAT family N-acetyltransferase [Rhodococcus sp. KRD162]|uniref:GNAT family N-acetyltransferase n=1 Tax=Rhodococcus sp. KRD162 TaxID=2729725 RepID=UPI0019D25435|nr:GNAT family N-acetyltransferase [Rhodococcus sp. KRD162]